MRTRVALAILAAWLIAWTFGGCASAPPAPPRRADAVFLSQIGRLDDSIPVLRFKPPRIYADWLRQVEACSGRVRTGWPTFYVAPINPLNARYEVAIYIYDGERIIFALGAETSQQIVSHELLHWILATDYMGQHPAEYYGNAERPGRCSGLVSIP